MKNFETMRTGKTGVAFGLLRSRDGANDVNIVPFIEQEAGEIAFPYLLGTKNRKDCFTCVIGTDIGYQVWAPFRRCTGDEMDIYYTKEFRALDGNVPISRVLHENLYIEEEHIQTNGYVYIRKTSPNTLECTVQEQEYMNGNPQIPDSAIYKIILK